MKKIVSYQVLRHNNDVGGVFRAPSGALNQVYLFQMDISKILKILFNFVGWILYI